METNAVFSVIKLFTVCDSTIPSSLTGRYVTFTPKDSKNFAEAVTAGCSTSVIIIWSLSS